jgi:hypothetical protein
MGYLLLALWYFVLFIAAGGLVLLAISILSGIVIALGVGVSQFWALLRGQERRIPRWAEWLDER